MDCEEEIKLPLEVQLWFLEQSGYFLRSKLDDRKYEAACVLFERVLCGYNKNKLKGKLQVVYSDLIRLLEHVHRWHFVKAACPYLIQCAAQILINRSNLGMSDRLSVAVTRLLSTLHWCFIDAPADCELNPKTVLFPAKTLALFVQLMVPCAHNIHEEDLTFSLKSGIQLWQPLWKNQCPDIPSFRRPVFLEKFKSTSPNFSSKRRILKYFDIVVLNSLSTLCLCEESLSWCLIYISEILQSELILFCKGPESRVSVRNLKHNGKKNVGITYSMPLLLFHSETKASSPPPRSPDSDVILEEVPRSSEDLEPVFLCDEYEQWLKEDGTLRHSAILDLVYKITKKATLRICETLLLTLHTLLELCIVNTDEKEERTGDIDVNVETAVYCLLDLITMIGCCNNDSGMRGSKGQDLRDLSHDMFTKLASANPHQLSLLVVLYARKKSVGELVSFLHSFTSFCIGKFDASPTPGLRRPNLASTAAVYRSLQREASHDSNTSDVKDKNEQRLMAWLWAPLLDKFMLEEQACKEELRPSIAKLLTYIDIHHPKIMRKMLMNGVLNSFSKSTERSTMDGGATATTDGSKRSHPASGSWHPREAKSKQNPKARDTAGADSQTRKRLPLSRAKGFSSDEFNESVKEATESPEMASVRQQPSKRSNKPPRESSSLSKAFANNNKFKIFKGTKRSRLASIIYSAVEADESPVFVDKEAGPKLVDLSALMKGIKHFRFITCFIAAGHVPEAALIASLIDLRAPVLARAAMLLECCHFVHICRKGSWDASLRPEVSSRRDMATMFHSWALAVGGKLDSLIERENEESAEELLCKAPERNVLQEGDLGAVSTSCPYALKLIACQLLLEITAFLRDSCNNNQGTGKETPRALANDNRKASSTSMAHGKKSLAGRSPRAPVIAVSDESSGAKRKSSAFGRYVVGSSPKYQRKLSRRSSKAHTVRQFRDNQLLTSSFDEEEEFPAETQDIRWVSSVAKLVKSIYSKVVDFSSENWALRFQKSWKNLKEGLDALYSSKSDGNVASNRRSAVIGELSMIPEQSTEHKEDPILDYLQYEVYGLHHVPYSILCKAALVTDALQFMEMMPCAWHMLLDSDRHLVSAAAAVVLMSGTQIGSFVTSFIKKEMSETDPTDRAKAVYRFSVLWKYRYKAWSKMETNAITLVKILPPKLDYTLPSPLIGRDPPLTADAPWVAGSPFLWETDESEIIQSEWYYDEEKRMQAKEKRRKSKLTELRQGSRLKNVPLFSEAGTEAKGKEDEDEDEDSWAPPQQSCYPELFPASICAVVLDVIRLMDDTALASDGKSVGNVAYQVVWNCLVDDPDLFFRSIYEKITKTNKQEEVILVLRKLVQQMPVLPPDAGTFLFNNLVGLIMFYSRTNKPGCHKKISSVLHVLWQVVPSVSNLFLKDMKQVLKKENCEQVFLVTANVPGVKEVRVMFDKCTEKFEVDEDTTFASLVDDCKKCFELFDKSLVLVDKYSGWLMESTKRVRDSFTFKRGFAVPVVKLERMEREKCYEERQAQAVIMKMSEISRLNLSSAILNVFPHQKHVAFFFLALLKQNAFPRKAIEFEFALCHEKGLAKELLTLDVILKDTWIKFICTLLGHLDETATAADEIEIFLNVLNGALLLLCDNVAILRSCLGGFINISIQFGQFFAVSGYQQVLPTLLKVYAQHQDNTLVTEAIEFTMGTFLTLHQSPFLLQLFASAAPILQSEVTQELLTSSSAEQIPSRVFFKLLLSFDRRAADNIGILSLVRGSKPIRPFDSVCKIENIEFSVIDIAVRLAVTVIASRPTSSRGSQMLTVVSTIVPHYLCHIRAQTSSAILVDEDVEGQEMMFKEMRQLRFLLNYLKVVIENSKHLGSPFSKNFSCVHDSPDAVFDDESPAPKPNVLSLSWWRSLLGGVRSWFGLSTEHSSLADDLDRMSVSDELPVSLEEQLALETFCLPRMSLLYLVSEFVTNGATRMRKIKEAIRRRVAIQEVVVDKSQVMILCEVVSALLSLAPRNQDILSNIGFERFMLQTIPSIKWADERIPLLMQMVENVNEILRKCLQHPEQLSAVNWNALEFCLRDRSSPPFKHPFFYEGINFTIWKQREIASEPQIKELIDLCVQVILCDRVSDGVHAVSISFATMGAKLAARLIQANPNVFSLPVVCADYYVNSDVIRLEKFLIHWFLPLTIRLGTGRYDYPRLSSYDTEFALSFLLSFLSSFETDFSFGSKDSLGSQQSLDLTYDTSVATIRTRRRSQSLILSPKTYKMLFLGLKVMLVAFEDSFGPYWKATAETVEKLMETNKDDPAMWDFFHFIVDNRSTLLVHLLPVVSDKLRDERSLSNEIRSRLTRIERDLWNPPTSPCKGDVLKHLLDELAELTHGNGDQADSMQMLSSPPGRGCGRSRTKSTYKSRSETLSRYDKKWEDYDKTVGYWETSFDDQVDGGAKQSLSRRRSSRKVTIASEPTVIEEGHVKEPNVDNVNTSGSKKILKRRPVLRRQAAEDEVEMDAKEISSEEAASEIQDNQPEKMHNFNRQRFQQVRKKEDSRSHGSKRNGKWKRDNSYRYRQRMQHQVSFNEEEELKEAGDNGDATQAALGELRHLTSNGDSGTGVDDKFIEVSQIKLALDSNGGLGTKTDRYPRQVGETDKYATDFRSNNEDCQSSWLTEKAAQLSHEAKQPPEMEDNGCRSGGGTSFMSLGIELRKAHLQKAHCINAVNQMANGHFFNLSPSASSDAPLIDDSGSGEDFEEFGTNLFSEQEVSGTEDQPYTGTRASKARNSQQTTMNGASVLSCFAPTTEKSAVAQSVNDSTAT